MIRVLEGYRVKRSGVNVTLVCVAHDRPIATNPEWPLPHLVEVASDHHQDCHQDVELPELWQRVVSYQIHYGALLAEVREMDGGGGWSARLQHAETLDLRMSSPFADSAAAAKWCAEQAAARGGL